MRRKHCLHGPHCALYFEVLRMLGDYGKSGGLKRCSHLGHICGTRSELRLELCRRQPLMVGGGGGIGLRAQQLFQRLLMRQGKIDVEMHHGVLIRRAKRLRHCCRCCKAGREGSDSRQCEEHDACCKRGGSHRHPFIFVFLVRSIGLDIAGMQTHIPPRGRDVAVPVTINIYTCVVNTKNSRPASALATDAGREGFAAVGGSA